MLTFFAITAMLDLHTATDLVLKMIKELQDVFPGSIHLRAHRAMVYYHMRGTISHFILSNLTQTHATHADKVV